MPGRRPAPARASRRCCGRSTAWSRTSPAARCRAGSSSTVATPATHRPRDLADLVGYVGQDPAAGFVTDTVEDELAYAMESLGLPPAVMRRRVEESSTCWVSPTCATGRCSRCPAASSSGSRSARFSRPAPRVLVLDEPTSALDPPAAEDVLAALTRLVHDLGLTVLLAEHRLERVLQYADLVVAWSATAGSTPRRPGP